MASLGWPCINVIVGAQVINAVNSIVPGCAGIIIIAVCTFIITLFGYKVVHAYELWSWIRAFIVFMIVFIEFAVSGAYVNILMAPGRLQRGRRRRPRLRGDRRSSRRLRPVLPRAAGSIHHRQHTAPTSTRPPSPCKSSASGRAESHALYGRWRARSSTPSWLFRFTRTLSACWRTS
ncbi:purine-cytosine permease [Phytophthora pseudosyringae]|uniref:Purine-cytosine permease n=1 Tax=Phytophthora pseudosyringae TaxID=221518 RepID=A0A8T1VDC4_9STRA|nr:purine-cytosine permease [Phytophthora pseudosyringae]